MAKFMALLAFFLFGSIAFLYLQKDKTPNCPAPLYEVPVEKEQQTKDRQKVELPTADLILELFNPHGKTLPITKTITYKSLVSWKPGRQAWIVDYARHFKTSKHFINRSLNQEKNYESPNIHEGDRFNILKDDVSFHLVVDTSRCRLWLYAIQSENDPLLIRDYPVCLGRASEKTLSGLLTPHGTYSLGDRIAVYRERSMGNHKGERIPMIEVFGTRWIPFESEVEGCTAPAKGFGIHGCPWVKDQGRLVENTTGLGDYQSDGCIRLLTEDVEELFSIIVSKKTHVELVDDFQKSKLFKKTGV